MKTRSRAGERYALAGSLLALTGALWPACANASGSLVVAPTRVVLHEGERSAEVQLVNRGTTPATYSVAFIHLSMSESGALTASEPDAASGRWADELLRFSPRRVTLGPGEAQTVRILARRPADLAKGEYRSHLVFRADPGAGADPTESPTEGGAAVQLRTVLGLSIPVFVRHHTDPPSLAISAVDVAREVAVPTLRFALLRAGSRSVYGDLIVERASSRPGAEAPLAALRGVAVYAPGELRRVAVDLPVDLPPGTSLRIRFEDREAGAGTLAERTVTLD